MQIRSHHYQCLEDEDLVLDQKVSEPEELEEEDDVVEPEIAPVEQMEEAEEPEVPPEPVATPPPGVATRVSSEPEHDVTLNFVNPMKNFNRINV